MLRVFIGLNILAMMSFGGCDFFTQEASQEQMVSQEDSSSTNVFLGKWTGLLDAGSMTLTLVFDLFQDVDGSVRATLACQEQGFSDMLVDVIEEDNVLKLDVQAAGASYEGVLHQEAMEIHGEFRQAGKSVLLILKKDLVAPTVLRPQEPKPPYFYREEEVSCCNPRAEVTLAGTLTMPFTEGPFPAVILIAGPGPLDRNETIFGHKPFLVLADHLTRQGIAVLRMDKRGVHGSSGDYDTSSSEDFADDILAGIDYLKTRKEINADQIGLIGHSEGGLIAPMVAVKSDDVAFVVLMAGIGVSGEDLLYAQGVLMNRVDGFDEGHIEHYLDFQRRIFSIVKRELDSETSKNLLREAIFEKLAISSEETRKALANQIEQQVEIYDSKWFRYLLAHDPRPTLWQLQVPVLVLNGELDVQVPSQQNLPAIEKALWEAVNRDYTIKEFPGLNHLFQTCKTGATSEYQQIEETLAPVVLDTISEWILQRTDRL